MARRNSKIKGIVVGVDATNLVSGGGLTHLIEFLNAAKPEEFGIASVIVWAPKATLSRLPPKAWLRTESPAGINGSKVRRLAWQFFGLQRALVDADCDILFVPGGSSAGTFKPFVTMSRNMLPFEWSEFRRYIFSPLWCRLIFLRIVQANSFKRANGVIFLNDYAMRMVQRVTGSIRGHAVIIPHGRSRRFEMPPRPQRAIQSYSNLDPLRILYVSVIQKYKHQWNVVEAVAALREKGFALHLNLVGPSEASSLKRLKQVISKVDSKGDWVNYCGAIPYEALHKKYAEADIGIFASSCENMPNILLEKMSAGLPIACSNRGPMPEILGDGGLYFDPEDIPSIMRAIESLISSTELRERLSRAAFDIAEQFTWEKCASSTLAFLAMIASSSTRDAKTD